MIERKDRLRMDWDACIGHVWERDGLVIDTLPEQETWFCRLCGAASHDGGETYCFIKHFDQGAGA